MSKKTVRKNPLFTSVNFPLTYSVLLLIFSLPLLTMMLGIRGFWPTGRRLKIYQQEQVPASYPIVRDGCLVTGCSGQVCADEPAMTTCEWLPEYACYKEPFAICEKQNDDRCGWTQNDEFLACLQCTEEGQTMPVVPGYHCCPGLVVINPVQPNTEGNCPSPMIGVSVCTKCGNGICGLGENKCNCPADCPKTTCPYDYDENGIVGVQELLLLLSNWGQCG